MSSWLVWIHVVAGTVAIVSGVAAFLVRKGNGPHRALGNTFVVSMIVMGLLGFYGAGLNGRPLDMANGLFVCYLVITSWMAARGNEGPSNPSARCASYSLVVLVAALAASDFYHGMQSAGTTAGMVGNGEIPAGPYYLFGFFCVLCLIGDVRLLFGANLGGRRRVARHLWRMGFALFVAAGSLFLGQPGVFPESLQDYSGAMIRAIPVLCVVVATIYWLVRVKFKGAARQAIPSYP